jgi:hypothetical protein
VAGIEIRRRPVVGEPVHAAGHEHEQSPVDFIRLAPTRTSPLAYSLLRAAAFPLSRHREVRAQAASDGFGMAAQKAHEVMRVDPERGERHWRQEGRLYLWDQIQILHEICEDLACVFESIRLSSEDAERDLGRELLRYHGPADKIIASRAFGDEAWWRAQIGVEADVVRFALLTDGQQAALREMLRGAGVRLSLALSTVRGTYTHALHRVAARRRHGISLLDPEHGLAWVGQSEADRKADMEALDAGALVVADNEGETVVEFLVPVTIEAYEGIRACWNHAAWLLSMLCGSIVARAESPSGTAVPMDDIAPPAPSPELEHAVVCYTGADPELWMREGRRRAATGAVYAVAERLAGGNRDQRHHPSKPGARRRKGR